MWGGFKYSTCELTLGVFYSPSIQICQPIVVSLVSKHLSAFRYGPLCNVQPSATLSGDAAGRLLLDLSAAREQQGGRDGGGRPQGFRSGVQISGLFLDPKGDPDYLGSVSISQEDFEVMVQGM